MSIFGMKEYEQQISHLKRNCEELIEENTMLKRKLSGERIPSEHCAECKHAIPKAVTILGVTVWACALDCKCKDFQRR